MISSTDMPISRCRRLIRSRIWAWIGDVERRRRLVGDQQRRPAGDRHGDHDALAQAARQLVRVLSEATLGRPDADHAEQLERGGARRGLAQAAVDAQHLGDLEADREGRVQAGHRLLEDHADAVAADVAHGRAELEQVAPLEHDAAGVDPARRRRVQAHDRHRRDALAAARLADQADGLAGVQRERDVLDDPHRAGVGQERDGQGIDLEEGRSGGSDGAARRRARALRRGAGQSNTTLGK